MHRPENQILLSSGPFAGMRETGGFGQPLHALYPQIRAVLASELGPEVAGLLAEPVVDRANNRIDWYAEGDPDHSPTGLSDLPEAQRQLLLTQVHDWLERGRGVAERYAVSEETRRAQLGAMLRAALGTPAETEVFLVEGRPVIIRWGFTSDRPWEAPTAPTRSPAIQPPAPKPPEPPRDVAMPEVALPELATAAPAPATGNEAPLEKIERQPDAPPVIPTPAPIPAEPLPATPPPLSQEPGPSSSSLESSPESKPVAATRDALLKPSSEPGTGWRYVVVGSRYFWGVFALAVLLAAMAVLWRGLGRSPLSSASDQSARLSPDPDLEHALLQAQHTETELRTRLESLLAQLAGRRGQCPSPTAGAGVDAPTVRESGHGRTVPARSTVADGGNARAPGFAAIPSVDTPPSDQAAMPSGKAPIGDRGTTPSTATPVALDRTALPATTPPDTAAPSDNANPSPTPPVSRAPTGRETPTQALEAALTERASAPTAPLRQPSSTQAAPPARTEPPAKIEPPVKTEPTPEERQEFASRLSAAGATTGEITATLLWNGPSDLDLVVRCPSGQQLDYRNPAMCGGALDVDANATRASLSDRPVENAFWPAGQATPGNYEIAVRYVPRKDEQTPQETPFQVRLIRGGQESVFKGTVRPQTVTPVTTFTVER